MSRMTMVTLMLAGMLASGGASAQNLLIRNATVHTMGPEGVLENTDILVRGGQIAEIGEDFPVPMDDFPVFDADGRPVTPGLFAGITALGLEEISLEANTVDRAYAGFGPDGLGPMRPEFDVTRAYNPHSSLVPITQVEGYTFAVLGAMRSAAIIGGEGRPVILDGGYDSFDGEPVLFIDVGADASGVSGGSRAAQWMLLEQAFAESGDENETLLTQRGRQRLADFATGNGLVVFQVDRASDILAAIRFATEHGLDAIIGGGAEAWMVADELAEAGVPVLLDPLLNLPGDFDKLGARLDNAALLHEAGVRIAFAQTPDMESHNARKMRQLAGNAVAHGLPHDVALRALTVGAAEIFGIDDAMGAIAPGQRADLVLWSGDPLEVTSAADQVFVGGMVLPMTSRQTRLRDRYLPENPEQPRQYIKP